ncbi:hypothetical protein SKAU_G00330380 [Synaphobranchus kaupii]|uniref:Uncharacterized protein n=1 Tax=Synaphobranchus kaupii TaxID=118154 RepID=A0A9Q1IJQ9_SYNKA|nr:hypothetical protein SKAU_G00330380 [Synaphobranchus kaupii]
MNRHPVPPHPWNKIVRLVFCGSPGPSQEAPPSPVTRAALASPSPLPVVGLVTIRAAKPRRSLCLRHCRAALSACCSRVALKCISRIAEVKPLEFRIIPGLQTAPSAPCALTKVPAGALSS